MLGVGSVGGCRRTTKVFRKRLANFKKKISKFDHLSAKGFNVKTAVRLTGMPSIAYGMEVAGAADTALADMRRTIVRAAGTSTAGGSYECELFAKDGKRGRLDPAFEAHSKPIKTLAQAWWDNWRKEDQLAQAHEAAMQKLRHPKVTQSSAWAHCNGPTTAAILSATRLGDSLSRTRLS